jgi:hypothetical protein
MSRADKAIPEQERKEREKGQNRVSDAVAPVDAELAYRHALFGRVVHVVGEGLILEPVG